MKSGRTRPASSARDGSRFMRCREVSGTKGGRGPGRTVILRPEGGGAQRRGDRGGAAGAGALPSGADLADCICGTYAVTVRYVYAGGAVAKKKLTLSVDERLITKVKRFSTRNQTTVSELFSDFVSTLEDDGGRSASVLDRLTGILSEETSREDYREHLREKHLG